MSQQRLASGAENQQVVGAGFFQDCPGDVARLDPLGLESPPGRLQTVPLLFGEFLDVELAVASCDGEGDDPPFGLVGEDVGHFQGQGAVGPAGNGDEDAIELAVPAAVLQYHHVARGALDDRIDRASEPEGLRFRLTAPTHDQHVDLLLADGGDDAPGDVTAVAQARGDREQRRQVQHRLQDPFLPFEHVLLGVAQRDMLGDGDHVQQLDRGVLRPAELVSGLDHLQCVVRISKGHHYAITGGRWGFGVVED